VYTTLESVVVVFLTGAVMFIIPTKAVIIIILTFDLALNNSLAA
jgi:hypothetical protein